MMPHAAEWAALHQLAAATHLHVNAAWLTSQTRLTGTFGS